ncbi:MAG TPA: biopolymer transporter ExbD [Candidatus Babeliales bacterium]|jgi:biopolymer transport protein TolR|nr:biopolymer transporter ExbD [Candidatus Babeliales bacterium]
MAYIPRKRRTRTQLTDIPLTPLIDTALTLLIIFMVASPMLNNMIKVTLPRGKVQEGSGLNQEIVIYIDQKNDIFFDGKSIDISVLITKLKELIGSKQDVIVFVKADEQAQYGTVLELIDNIKSVSGVQHVALATQKYT